jgi:putative ABC transport system ATP-binding protein
MVKMKEFINFENVTKTYRMGETTISALDGVSFKINKGELVIILGASGAGKTTVLNLLGGMDSPSSGSIYVDNQNISKSTKSELTLYRRDKVGFVFQFYNLIFNLTSLENVEFASAFSKDKMDSREVLNKVGLSERLKNFPSQLSGGEQQRVAIARAIAKNPTLLLCDEPTGALDYRTGKDVLKLLASVNKEFNKTVIIITHNSALADMGNKVIHVKSGKIEKIVENANPKNIDDIEW